MRSERSVLLPACLLGVLVVFPGCGRSLTRIDPIAIPVDRSAIVRPQYFTRLVASAEAQGYQPVVVQLAHRRFGVIAHYAEGENGYRIAIECDPDGRVRLTPIGARVELLDGMYIVPERLRDELVVLAEALQQAAP